MAVLAAMALAAMLVSAMLAYVLAQRSDDRLQRERRDDLVRIVDDYRALFADATLHRAAELAAVNGPRVLSPAELEQRLVPSGNPRLRAELIYVLDTNGTLVASFPSGETAIPAGVQQLVERLRTSGRDVVASDFVAVGDQPALAAAAIIRSAAPRILVAVAGLDAGRLGIAPEDGRLDGLRLDADPPSVRHETQGLHDRAGRIVGWISWDNRRPMTEAMTKLAPLLAVVALCFLGFAGLALFHFRRVARQALARAGEARDAAHDDVLTGVPGRHKFFAQLDQALAERKPGQIVSLAHLDVNGFRDINESFGHETGDEMLAEIAARMRVNFPPPAICGRYGGDAFGAIVTTTDPEAAMRAANGTAAAMANGCWTASPAAHIAVSIGLAQAPRDGTTRDELLRCAELALRAAKRRRLHVADYAQGVAQEFQDRETITRELPRALAEGELEVHYQPIMAADGLQILGVEALCRWQHPTRGYIPPAVFVPIAEQTGLTMQLGEFVLRQAFADAMSWPDIYVAVNLSPVQVRDRRLIEVVIQALRDTGLPSARAVLEITEGVLIEDPEEAKEALGRLRSLGCRIALDDFGTGYSSLSYLQRYPINKLKIDKEFVQPLGRSANGGVIIQAIVALGRALGLTVCCEGVETEEQRVLLRLAGCDEMQGYLFAKPGPRAQIDRWLAARRQSRGMKAPAAS
jgi:diguanylate cyclase (GGDEF)-like protein